jgi:hypothetical protein
MSATEAVLTRVIGDVLTNPDLEHVRLTHSKKGDKRFALVNHEEFGSVWPPGFSPSIPGYECFHIDLQKPQPQEMTAPLLGIRLDKCDLGQQEVGPFDGNVIVSISNVGGHEGDGNLVVSGTSIYYVTKREQGGWSVSWQRVSHP